jgi:hypothetical protein
MEDVEEMPEPDQVGQPAASPRGEAGWKAHKQAIAAANDRTRAAAKRQRLEREQREADKRKANEYREDAEFARKLNARQPT